jgi:peptide/nickel transport system substrate-binding protein
MDPAATFSDGSPVTASDIKFSWEYMTWPETASWASSYLTGPIAGYADVVAGTTKELTGIVVVDDATLEITLTEPFTPFSKAMALNVGGVVKKENVMTGDDWDSNPVCCGPYKLESWDKASGELNWVTNEHWWKTPPTIQKVNYRYVQDPSTQGIMYDNDEVDVVQPSDILAAQMKVGPSAAELLPIPQGGTVFFAFDTTRAPMEDVNVRRALLKASDMGTIIQAVFQGGANPAFGLTSPNLAGFADPGPYYDPEGAKAALAASTYGSADKLPQITIRVPTNVTEYVRVTEALQQMWKEILGIDQAISLRAQCEAADDGDSQAIRLSNGTLNNDPTVIVAGLGLSSSSFMVNTVKAKNDELDAILIDANTRPADEVEKRIELSQQAEQILMDQAYYIPIIWVEYYFATKPWVNGLKSNSVLSLYSMPEMTISAH